MSIFRQPTNSSFSFSKKENKTNPSHVSTILMIMIIILILKFVLVYTNLVFISWRYYNIYSFEQKLDEEVLTFEDVSSFLLRIMKQSHATNNKKHSPKKIQNMAFWCPPFVWLMLVKTFPAKKIKNVRICYTKRIIIW